MMSNAGGNWAQRVVQVIAVSISGTQSSGMLVVAEVADGYGFG